MLSGRIARRQARRSGRPGAELRPAEGHSESGPAVECQGAAVGRRIRESNGRARTSTRRGEVPGCRRPRSSSGSAGSSRHRISIQPSRRHQVRRVEVLNGPTSALQAAIASSPVPSRAGSNSPSTPSSGGSRWRVSPPHGVPRPPSRLVMPQQVLQRRPDHRQRHRPVDHLEVVEEVLHLLVARLDLRPAIRRRLPGPATEKVLAHLDAVERVAAAVAEPPEHVAQVLEFPLVGDDREQ